MPIEWVSGADSQCRSLRNKTVAIAGPNGKSPAWPNPPTATLKLSTWMKTDRWHVRGSDWQMQLRLLLLPSLILRARLRLHVTCRRWQRRWRPATQGGSSLCAPFAYSFICISHIWLTWIFFFQIFIGCSIQVIDIGLCIGQCNGPHQKHHCVLRYSAVWNLSKNVSTLDGALQG